MAGIGGTGGLANEAFRAALRAQQETSRQMGLVPNPTAGQGIGVDPSAGIAAPTDVGGPSGVQSAGSDFAAKLESGLAEVTQSVKATEKLPESMVQGQVGEFHEVALQLKQSDLSFRFALQVRNKLIDAYREVMRMSV